MSSSIRTRETERNILIEMYQFALELSNSEIPKLYELGHYLADNLISKICMVVAQECDTDFNSTNYENKGFPDLFRDTIEAHYPNALRYSDIEELHKQRNVYQHKFWSILHHFNRQYALDYISKVKLIMISIGIISLSNDVQPSNYLKNQEREETTRRTSVEPTSYLSLNEFRLDKGNISYNQEKWHKFYNRMANIDPKYLGIEIQNLLNNKINEADFEEVLKMNIGAHRNYLKIYSNKEWHFSFTNLRIANDKYEIIVRNENTQQTYNFFKPNVNKNVLKEWLDYIVKSCYNAGIKIDY